MYTAVEGARVPIRMWTDPATVADAAMGQLYDVANLPWIHGLAVMPDVHYGKGATVGSVIAMRDAISPAAVGVDIGCGMSAVRTSLWAEDLPDDLGALRRRIEAAVPVGFDMHKQPVDTSRVPDVGGWDNFWNQFSELHDGVQGLREKAVKQVGTLGGGNHFIEVCIEQPEPGKGGGKKRSNRAARRSNRSARRSNGTAHRHDDTARRLEPGRFGSEPGRVWLMLHSGSRNIGNQLAQRHIEIAKTLPHNADLPAPDLAVFVAGTPEMQAYRRDLFWAQDYAARNRATMVELVKQALRDTVPGVYFDEAISCHHNYVAEETYDGVDLLITRKGAIRAGSGEIGIIPGSMGTGSYIVRGLGNHNSFQSAAHGAGRRMSRNKARKTYSTADLVEQTRGVECRKDRGVVDEIPGAYKDIESVIQAQTDLVEVVAHLKQVVCVKG